MGNRNFQQVRKGSKAKSQTQKNKVYLQTMKKAKSLPLKKLGRQNTYKEKVMN